MSLATPRILPTHLHVFSPAWRPSTSTVRILGSITSLRGDQAVLESANHETVTLILNRDSHLSLHSTYEIVGKVLTLDGGMGLGLRVLGATEWPKHTAGGTAAAIDMRAYEAVVDATHRYKGIFYEGESSGGGGGGRGGGTNGGAGYDGAADDGGDGDNSGGTMY